MIVQPVTSMIFWHVWKEPRAASAVTWLPAAPPLRRGRLNPERSRRARAPGEVTVPVLALSF